MPPYAILVDVRKCIGCRGCQVACKRWFGLSAEKTTLREEWTNPPDYGPNTWTYVKFHLKWDKEKDSGVWRFVKRQCMHCLQPTCVAVCPSGAKYKTREGPVLYDPKNCIGCRYCVTACPFKTPRFDWEKSRAVMKCTMCADRILAGLRPACVETCPTGALTFGEREEVVEKADLAAAEGAYVYGRRSYLGATGCVYVSDIPLTEVGFPALGPQSHKMFETNLLAKFAGIGVVGALIVFGLNRFSERREKMKRGK